MDENNTIPSDVVQTIKQVLDRIDNLLDQRPHYLNVTHNDTYGYPEMVQLDTDLNLFDDEITTIISNLTFLADSIVTGGAENATLDNDDRNVTTDGGDTNSSLDAE